MSTMTEERISAGSYYLGRIKTLKALKGGIDRATKNGEDPAKIQNAQWELEELEAEIFYLEARGDGVAYW
jgi:hypothetical protein